MNNPLRKRVPARSAIAPAPRRRKTAASPAAKRREVKLRQRQSLPSQPQQRADQIPPQPKPQRRSRPRPPAKRVAQLQQPSRWQGILTAIAAVTSSTAFLFGGAWLSVQLIVDPQSVNWVQSVLPAWSPVPIANKEKPQTLQQIEAQIRDIGLIPAPSLSMVSGSDTQTQSKTAKAQLLLPVMVERPCSDKPEGKATCQQLVELRAYQPVFNPDNPSDRQPYYQLISQLPIAGVDRSLLLSDLSDADPGAFTDSEQPLTRVKIFENAPKNGIWIDLSSERAIGETKLTYGQVVHYNPETSHFSVMTDWVSPGGHTPRWQEITGGGDPELAIEQTVGMEPQVQIYQVKPVQFFLNPIALEEISLLQPVLSSRAYKDALMLGKSRLWTPAWELMASLKQDSQGKNWPVAAQAQLDLIRFHAQISQTQAKANWDNPTQQVLTALIDGNWKKALEVYELQLKLGDDMVELLKDDSIDWWNRIETAAQVNPTLAEVKAWGVLWLAANYDEAEAIAWFEEQPQNSSQLRERMYDLLDRFRNASAYAENLKTHKSQLVGTASMLSQVNPAEWSLPGSNASLDLESGKVWYQINLTAFNDSRQWRQAPFTDIHTPKSALGTHLWKELGLHNDAQIQIAVWMPNGEQKTAVATVKAVRLVGGNVLLLAAGDAVPTPEIGGRMSKPLVLTGSALSWRSPEPKTLAQLNKEDPEWAEKILPGLWQELQAAGQLPAGAVPDREQMLKQLGSWFVQAIDLTGNGWSEAVVTLRADALVRSPISMSEENFYRTRTLIFDDLGQLIYSELSTAAAQSVTGIAQLAGSELPVLVVEGNNGYSLQRWSSDRQRFEF